MNETILGIGTGFQGREGGTTAAPKQGDYSTCVIRRSPEHNHAAVAQHYARLARNYDRRWDLYTRRTLTTLIGRLDLEESPTDLHVLDVACGTGRLAAMILDRKPQAHITGVDLSAEMIEVARRQLPERYRRNASWMVASAEQLPFRSESFNVITCANAFHLMADQQATLAEFHRVLRPRGRVVIIDWCREYPTMALLLMLSRLFGRQYRRITTTTGLSRTLADARFRLVHVERFRATWFWGMMCIVGERAD